MSDPRLKSIAERFRSMADLIDAGMILDAAYAVVPTEGDPYMGFAIAPRKPDVLVAALNEVAGWIGQTEKNAAIEQAMSDHIRTHDGHLVHVDDAMKGPPVA